MARIASIVVLMAVAAACGGDRGSTTPQVAASPAPLLPASSLPRMEVGSSVIDRDDLAREVTHPEALATVLAEAGLVQARQRSFSGGTGAFSRVTARGLAFGDAGGAAEFLSWFAEHAGTEIVTAERIEPEGLPAGAVVFSHEPDPCCHNDVPAFLAAWPRGHTVLYLHVGGRKATAAAFTALIADYDREA